MTDTPAETNTRGRGGAIISFTPCPGAEVKTYALLTVVSDGACVPGENYSNQ